MARNRVVDMHNWVEIHHDDRSAAPREHAPGAGAEPISAASFREVVEAAPVGVVVIAPDGRISLTNRELDGQFGYDRGQLVGRPVEVLVPEQLRDRHVHDRTQYIQSGAGPRRMGMGNELVGVRRDGEYIDLSIGLTPINTPQGRAVVAYVVDVTARRRIESALRESEQRFRILADAAPVLIWMSDAIGQYVHFNRRWLDFTGQSIEQQSGDGWRQSVHPDDLEACVTVRDAAFDSRQPFSAQFRMRRHDGVYRWVHDTGQPRLDDENRFLGFIGSCIDITEQKAAEDALECYAAKLEDRNRELDEFTYVASHDLQEPLRKLISFSRLLEEDIGGDLSPHARTDLDQITDAAQRMRRLVQALLALSRTGKSAMKIELTSLTGCAVDAIESLEARLRDRGAMVCLEPLPDLEVDATLVTQLFQNLIGNAAKFVPPGRRPRITVGAERRDGAWVTSVRDNGIGIDPAHATRIFEPFKRLNDRDAYEGTGIGLSICRKAVRRHDGRIWIESQPGRGSSFRFTLAPGSK